MPRRRTPDTPDPAAADRLPAASSRSCSRSPIASELLQLSALAFTAGVLLSVAVEEIGPQAHDKEPRTSALALVGGFAVFALVAAYVET